MIARYKGKKQKNALWESDKLTSWVVGARDGLSIGILQDVDRIARFVFTELSVIPRLLNDAKTTL